MNENDVVQALLMIFSAAAIGLVTSDDPKRRRWGPVFGILGQPFWIYSAFHSGQWGICVLSIWYTVQWVKAIHTMWVSPWLESKIDEISL